MFRFQFFCNVCKSFLIPLLFFTSVTAQPKGYLYDEGQVKPYSLPDPLYVQMALQLRTKISGCISESEILRIFEDEIYGHSPDKPKNMQFQEAEEWTTALAGKAKRKQIVIHLGKGEKALAVNLLIYSPSESKEPVPGFLTINFSGNHTVTNDPNIRIPSSWVRNRNGIKNNRARDKDRGSSSSRWAINEIIIRGYAFATVYYGDIDPDFHDGYQNGPHAIFNSAGDNMRKPSDWGSIAAWAWGLSRCMDYLETNPIIDTKRVADVLFVSENCTLGRSMDQRFAMVISNNQGVEVQL